VSVGREQGHPGSNQVTVLGGSYYGGYLLNTPKNFRTIAEVENFVKYAKSELKQGRTGRKVAFMP
jgi:hypothetical protein